MAGQAGAAAAAGRLKVSRGSAVLALAICAYASALALHGNGFIAAFAGGLAFGAAGGRGGERLVPFVEETGAWCRCWSGCRSAPSQSCRRCRA